MARILALCLQILKAHGPSAYHYPLVVLCGTLLQPKPCVPCLLWRCPTLPEFICLCSISHPPGVLFFLHQSTFVFLDRKSPRAVYLPVLLGKRSSPRWFCVGLWALLGRPRCLGLWESTQTDAFPSRPSGAWTTGPWAPLSGGCRSLASMTEDWGTARGWDAGWRLQESSLRNSGTRNWVVQGRNLRIRETIVFHSLYLLNWSVAVLQYCVRFIYSSDSFLYISSQILFHYRL